MPELELPYYTLVVLPEVENYGIDARIEKLKPLLCEAYGNVHPGTKATVTWTDIIQNPLESPNIYLAFYLYVEEACSPQRV